VEIIGAGPQPTVNAGRLAVALSLVVLCVTGTKAAGLRWQSAAGANGTGAKPPTVLFLCPHGAAKSVLASAYFQQLAKERGLNVCVESAGTDPDPAVAPAVASHLKAKGYAAPAAKPRRATAADMATADVVVSIGCDLKDLPAPRGTLVRWDDVPAPSADSDGAAEKIRERVMELVDELVGKQRIR
jgi:arsenate reductase (thioredoxin)